jgi:hypothetical protein
MNVCILYPPHVEPESVPLGAVRLAARLEEAGAQVELLDANQLAWARWLDPGHLGRQVRLLLAERQRLSTRTALQGAEAWAYCRALRGTVGWSLLLSRLDSARAELASPGSADRRAWARRIIEVALDTALWPATGQASLHDLTLAHSTESSSDVLALADDTTTNPYAAFWAAWLDTRTAVPDHIVLWLEADQQLVPAATLTAELRRRRATAQVHLDGPFGAFLRRCDVQHGTAACGRVLGVSQVGLGMTFPSAAQATGEERWLSACLSQRVLGAPAVALGADAGGINALKEDLALVRRTAPSVQAHITTPLPLSDLLAVADTELECGDGAAWSATLRYGFALDAASATRLRRAGCRALHFEVKGFAGYDMPQERALATMLRSFEQARVGGLVTLGSAVYGFPSDSDAAFAAFAEAMAREPQALDRWVRFRLWRLYRYSEPWREPARHDIKRVFAEEPGRDWCRHVNFLGRHGLDSREFGARAVELHAQLATRSQDFPASPLISDDAGLGLPFAGPATAAAEPADLLEAVPEDAVHHTDFDFTQMDRLLGSHVPANGHPWPQQQFMAGSGQWLARGFSAERLSVIGSGTAQLVQRCRAPVSVDALSALLARGGGDGAALLNRMMRAGLVRPTRAQS